MAVEKGEFDDLKQKIASLEREKHLLLMKVEELEASGNHQRVELELKVMEIRSLKQKLEEVDDVVIKYSEWEKEKDELAKRVREMLTKVSELEKKLENLISERLIIEREQVGGSSGGNIDWWMVAAIAISVFCYLRDGTKP